MSEPHQKAVDAANTIKNKIPSTRFYNSCLQAIKETTQYLPLTTTKKEELNQQLSQIPIDDNKLKDFLLEQLGKTTFNQIMSKTEKIIEEKNKQDTQRGDHIERFHGFIAIDNYQENAQTLYEITPYFYDQSKIWWLWKKHHWEIVDETDMSILLDNTLGFCGQTITSTTKNNYLEAMKRIGRMKQPQEAPAKWIQFKDKAFSLNTQNTYQAQPNYFFCNPIPWEIGETENTPTMDKLFKEWVGEKYVQTLYEVIAYCCYTKYPIHSLFCLYGIGRNGKDCYLRLVTKFLGTDNVCSTDLDLIAGNNRSRFESSKMFKKLAAMMGETNFGVLQHSNTLKQLTGASLMGYEMKGKDGFSGYNYAKILIASNSLPTSLDTTDGWFSRWCIIDFPNRFPEGKDVLATIPDVEYNNLAKKVCRILPEVLNKGSITNQGTIEERKAKYIMASNPLPFFIEKYCHRESELFTRYSEFYTAYCNYLKINNRRVISITEMGKILAGEGYEIRRTTKDVAGQYSSDRWVEGIGLEHEKLTKITVEKQKSLVGYDDYDDYDLNPTLKKHAIGGVGMPSYSTFSSQDVGDFPQPVEESVTFPDISNSSVTKKAEIRDSLVNNDIIHQKCYVCGDNPCLCLDERPCGKGRPICETCFKMGVTK